MIDRTEFDLRVAAHTRRTASINGQGWRLVTTVSGPTPRAALATLLLRLAARLDPALILAREAMAVPPASTGA
jgi:hypothetical protein